MAVDLVITHHAHNTTTEELFSLLEYLFSCTDGFLTKENTFIAVCMGGSKTASGFVKLDFDSLTEKLNARGLSYARTDKVPAPTSKICQLDSNMIPMFGLVSGMERYLSGEWAQVLVPVIHMQYHNATRRCGMGGDLVLYKKFIDQHQFFPPDLDVSFVDPRYESLDPTTGIYQIHYLNAGIPKLPLSHMWRGWPKAYPFMRSPQGEEGVTRQTPTMDHSIYCLERL